MSTITPPKLSIPSNGFFANATQVTVTGAHFLADGLDWPNTCPQVERVGLPVCTPGTISKDTFTAGWSAAEFVESFYTLHECGMIGHVTSSEAREALQLGLDPEVGRFFFESVITDDTELTAVATVAGSLAALETALPGGTLWLSPLVAYKAADFLRKDTPNLTTFLGTPVGILYTEGANQSKALITGPAFYAMTPIQTHAVKDTVTNTDLELAEMSLALGWVCDAFSIVVP